MTQVLTLHPDNPQSRVIEEVIGALQSDAVVLYPTDTVYAIGCDLQSRSAISRVRQIKQMTSDKPLTFLCSSLSNIASYALVSDSAYRVMRKLIPGPYTFVLPATKLVPKLVMNPKRRTTGIRVPNHPVCLAIIEALENPIISTSAHLVTERDGTATPFGLPNDQELRHLSRYELFDRLEGLVDVIVDDGSEPSTQVSTILDFASKEPMVLRRGLGWDAIADWILQPTY